MDGRTSGGEGDAPPAASYDTSSSGSFDSFLGHIGEDANAATAGAKPDDGATEAEDKAGGDGAVAADGNDAGDVEEGTTAPSFVASGSAEPAPMLNSGNALLEHSKAPNVSSKRRISRRVSIVSSRTKSQQIDMADLPPDLHDAIKDFDEDGDGVITVNELVRVAVKKAKHEEESKLLKAQNELFKRAGIASLVVTLCLAALLIGVTTFVIYSSKDTYVEGHVAMNKDMQPLSMNVNMVTMSIGSLAFMPTAVAAQIRDVTIRGTDGEDIHLSRKSLIVKAREHVILTTTDGGEISWSVERDGGRDVLIKMPPNDGGKDGGEWTRPAGCESCTAVSITNSDEVRAALGEFNKVVGLPEKGRRLDNHECDASAEQQQVELAPVGNDCSPGYTKLTTPQGCRVALSQLSLSSGFQGSERSRAWPGGCYHCDGVDDCIDGAWFNYRNPGQANGDARPICASQGFEDDLGIETLFIGDSDIARWEASSSTFPNSSNGGVGGFTCDDVNGIIDANLDTLNPNWVVVVCGENDLNDQGVTKTFEDFQAVIQKILNSGARALYLGTKPEPSTRDMHAKYQRYDAEIWNYADALAASSSPEPAPLTVIDVHAAFVFFFNPNSLYDRDRLHLSNRGYDYWNTWATTALNNPSTNVCVRWKNNVCDDTGATTQDVVVAQAGNVCPAGYTKLATAQGCQDAMGQLSLSNSYFQGTETDSNWPRGCYYCNDVAGCTDGVWFNSHSVGNANGGAMPICGR